jgi:PCO_ADO
LQQCHFPEFENFKTATANYKNEEIDWFEHEVLHKEIDFQISLLQFEKGEYIGHHDHPSMCGVINMVTGNALVNNYSIHKILDKEETKMVGEKSFVLQSCLIKKEQEELLLPNKISTLTSTQGNIHSLMPNEFTQLVDIFTPAYNPSSEEETKWFTVNEKETYEGLENIFEAQYLKK